MNEKTRLNRRMKAYLQYSIYLGILLTLLDAAMFAFDAKAAVFLLFYLIFYYAVTLLLYFHNRSIVMNEMISFATEYGQIQGQLLRELDLPHALLDETGKVLWTNEAFEEVVHEPKGYRKSITALFPTITKDKLPDATGEMQAQYKIEHEGSNYQAKFKTLFLKNMTDPQEMLEGEEGNYLIAMYLFDETALHLALQEVDDQSLAVGLIYIDNYDEAMKSVEEVRRSLLTAVIDRRINKYISSVDGICKKLEKDKYLIVLRKRSLSQLRQTRFEILEEIKGLNIGNEMAVTISIGVGLDGLSYAQNYEFARNAIDLALGRGGDQTVVKAKDSITYYGGKSQHVEKNTRVKARVKAHALREIINGKDQVLVMGHRGADPDCFGASMGIYRVAQTLGRKAHIVMDNPPTAIQPMLDMFKNHPEYEEGIIINGQQAMDMAGGGTVLVVVDVNKPSLTEYPELLRACKTVVVLDHHRQGEETIDNATLSYVEPYASSACELVSEILQYTHDNIKMRPEEADCMYAGIMVDTNNFMAKTGVRTFESAAFLRRNGADASRVRKLFREDVLEYKSRADVVSHAEIYKQFAISECKAEGLSSPLVLGAQAADELLNIRGVKASFVLTDYQGQVNISARSIDEVNVQLIMEKMGGGGHLNNAACQIKEAKVEDVVATLKKTIDSMLENNEI
ncbi:MAG: DHH family phosphoesterase [Lachnospiraceae bacterium]|nr:DHH family phosphoesterase [Lachnospiraceae bacterium]